MYIRYLGQLYDASEFGTHCIRLEPAEPKPPVVITFLCRFCGESSTTSAEMISHKPDCRRPDDRKTTAA